MSLSLWTPHKMSLNWTLAINSYVCGSLIFLCWLNRTHLWNLLSELFFTLRLSELLFVNWIISTFASTFLQISHNLRTINAQINISGGKARKLDTLAKLQHDFKHSPIKTFDSVGRSSFLPSKSCNFVSSCSLIWGRRTCNRTPTSSVH